MVVAVDLLVVELFLEVMTEKGHNYTWSNLLVFHMWVDFIQIQFVFHRFLIDECTSFCSFAVIIFKASNLACCVSAKFDRDTWVLQSEKESRLLKRK